MLELPEDWQNPEYDWLKGVDFAKFIRVHRMTVYKWAKDGTLDKMGFPWVRRGPYIYIRIKKTVYAGKS